MGAQHCNPKHSICVAGELSTDGAKQGFSSRVFLILPSPGSRPLPQNWVLETSLLLPKVESPRLFYALLKASSTSYDCHPSPSLKLCPPSLWQPGGRVLHWEANKAQRRRALLALSSLQAAVAPEGMQSVMFPQGCVRFSPLKTQTLPSSLWIFVSEVSSITWDWD